MEFLLDSNGEKAFNFRDPLCELCSYMQAKAVTADPCRWMWGWPGLSRTRQDPSCAHAVPSSRGFASKPVRGRWSWSVGSAQGKPPNFWIGRPPIFEACSREVVSAIAAKAGSKTEPRQNRCFQNERVCLF